MIPGKLYKYLDFYGGKKMLENSNLQFTNATKLNDPFDCHPGLINFSDVPKAKCEIWPPDIIRLLESDPYKKLREQTWLCSLSKVYDELLMWSYYGGHKGVCVGLDMEMADKYLSEKWCGGNTIGISKVEVQYKDIINKPDYFRYIGLKSLFHYQLSTKAKAWEHEKEVRLLMDDPNYGFIPAAEPKGLRKSPEDAIDYKEIRFYLPMKKEYFCSLYIGATMGKDNEDEIIGIARTLNPEMKIYKMTVDPDAFRLKPQSIDFD